MVHATLLSGWWPLTITVAARYWTKGGLHEILLGYLTLA